MLMTSGSKSVDHTNEANDIIERVNVQMDFFNRLTKGMPENAEVNNLKALADQVVSTAQTFVKA